MPSVSNVHTFDERIAETEYRARAAKERARLRATIIRRHSKVGFDVTKGKARIDEEKIMSSTQESPQTQLKEPPTSSAPLENPPVI